MHLIKSLKYYAEEIITQNDLKNFKTYRYFHVFIKMAILHDFSLGSCQICLKFSNRKKLECIQNYFSFSYNTEFRELPKMDVWLSTKYRTLRLSLTDVCFIGFETEFPNEFSRSGSSMSLQTSKKNGQMFIYYNLLKCAIIDFFSHKNTHGNVSNVINDIKFHYY